MMKNSGYVFLMLLLGFACLLEVKAIETMPSCIDLSVCNVSFGDSKAFQKTFGNLPIRWERSMPSGVVYIMDKQNRNVFGLKNHPGSYNDCFDEVTISADGVKSVGRNFEQDSTIIGRFDKENLCLVTGKGIRLGMSESAVIDTLGKPSKRTKKNGRTILTYKVKLTKWMNEHNPVLHAVNMYEYYGEYEFGPNGLMCFSFGFEML